MSISSKRLRGIITELLPELIEFRHDLHAHPELRYEEVRTSHRVQNGLEAAGIEYVSDLAGGTGILALIPGADADRTVALRADMDALPITEATGLPYASTNAGVMHACGHDGHTTMCLGAARVLKRIADEQEAGLPRPVKLVFQPAEEGGAGGKRMVEDGVLGGGLLGPAVTEMWGQHCWPLLELGKVATRPGPLLAAADMFAIIIDGKMAHAAWPQGAKDPIVAGAQIVTALQTIASRNVDPIDSVVVSITKFHAGFANNVIPDSAELGGTLRTLTVETRVLARKRIKEIVEMVAGAMECSARLQWEGEGYPVTYNDEATVDRFFRFARAAVGRDNAPVWPVPVMGGEDFSFYCREVPACFFVLGQNPADRSEPYPLVHTPGFDFNDDSIALGVEMLCRLALELDEP